MLRITVFGLQNDQNLPISIWSASFPVVLLQRVPLVQYAPWEPINLEKCWVEICIKFEKDCLVLGHCTSLLNFQLSVPLRYFEKIREIIILTKEVTKNLISRNIFSVREFLVFPHFTCLSPFFYRSDFTWNQFWRMQKF